MVNVEYLDEPKGRMIGGGHNTKEASSLSFFDPGKGVFYRMFSRLRRRMCHEHVLKCQVRPQFSDKRHILACGQTQHSFSS